MEKKRNVCIEKNRKKEEERGKYKFYNRLGKPFIDFEYFKKFLLVFILWLLPSFLEQRSSFILIKRGAQIKTRGLNILKIKANASNRSIWFFI